MMIVHRELMTVDEFREYALSFDDGDHPLPQLHEDLPLVAEVISCYREEAESYEDTSSHIVVRLTDGRYGIFEEWSDSSGHG